MFFNTRPNQASSNAQVTPIASSIVIKSLSDLQTQLATEIDKQVAEFPVPAPKTAASAELVESWRRFPRSCEWYGKLIKRLAAVSASVSAEQAVAELTLQWLPPAFGSAQPGSAFLNSQFDFAKFAKRLECLNLTLGLGGGDRKELNAKQAEEARNLHVVQIVVCAAICDVLEALLEPRGGQVAPIDPDIGSACVQLAFDQFNPQSARATQAEKCLSPAVAAALQQRTVTSWAKVVCHLARSQFDKIKNELTGRVHAAKTADDVFHLLVGTQKVTIPSLAAPACAPFFDQFRQIVLSDRKLYREPLMRLCVVHSLERLATQADCGATELDPIKIDELYGKLHAMFGPLQEWAEKPELVMATTQLLALIVCHSPPAFWQAHMDVSKEAKKRTNQLLGGKKEGLLRLLLTDHAYDDKTSRAALCGVLRLLAGGHPLPTSIIGRPADAEWWRDGEADRVTDGSLMDYTMRTFGPSSQMPAHPRYGHGGGGGGDDCDEETLERLRFVVEKLFERKTSGRHVRLPKLLECGDVLVYIIGQVAAHSLVAGLEALELLLADPRDFEYNLLGVCALGRILKAPHLPCISAASHPHLGCISAGALGRILKAPQIAAKLTERLGYFAERLLSVIERCEAAVGASLMGYAQRAMPVTSIAFDDSVQVMGTARSSMHPVHVCTRASG